ncbi:MAG TPA: potassium transporter Kup [Chlorobaculum sp.]|uniref:Probable potassium transport system protein Kup n=1 Tax=Chlorobaculum tepidum (strain ATCC 49652 / DSM 12025 / NBRC 103806 / TLS) TaxID=194439 RepID=KUP_CHLTE|nr:RecName: Full=Probable potassium transport system protein Kup [Chlorobaculum tepidum TLS]AAM73290.1 Kup system potassium uptake protein [Chlorobaculum tepidum TLS]HBU23404.1 potassium transporter Kup [Chlorobaculum sp.]
MSLAALGVVFGDIGTSPLYAIRECFHGEFSIPVNTPNVLGVLSLLIWALLLIVTLKYLTFIMKADNEGEGGILALTALIISHSKKNKSERWILVSLGLFGAALLYGDGMITPSISVLSAVEGIQIIAPSFGPLVIPVTIAILAGLFLFQHHGTAKVGSFFGPIILLWFTSIGLCGLVEIVKYPAILKAVFPWYGLEFLVNNHAKGFLVLGAVFLAVTGAEALYADMGHFGRRPIRLTWSLLVLPALLLNYFGQGAVLLSEPAKSWNPFYALVPSWGIIPMVILATLATIIASQALITGIFSLTQQGIQLGYIPRLTVQHTSASHIGQIYVPAANWALMFSTIALVAGFGSSSKLASAYGVAVTATMLISAVLFYYVARDLWNWNRLGLNLLMGMFMLIDLSFFGASVSKLFHGAWFPLVIGFALFTLMLTWKQGRLLLMKQIQDRTLTVSEFTESLAIQQPQRVKGQAIYLTANPDVVPMALLHNMRHNKILHSEVGLLHFSTERVPRVPNSKKVEVIQLNYGMYKIIARYGFMEYPNIRQVLALANQQGMHFRTDAISYFINREKIVTGMKSKMSVWRKKLFALMARNALSATAYYDLPSGQVIEIGVQVQI